MDPLNAKKSEPKKSLWPRKMARKDRHSSAVSRPCPSGKDASSTSDKHRVIRGGRDPWLSFDDEWTWIDWFDSKNTENDISTEEYMKMRLRAEYAAALRISADNVPVDTALDSPQPFTRCKNPSITQDHRIYQDRSDSGLDISPPKNSAASFRNAESNSFISPNPSESPVQQCRRLWGRLFGCLEKHRLFGKAP
jgi:hypothetical protein